jgi:hypothetical protein
MTLSDANAPQFELVDESDVTPDVTVGEDAEDDRDEQED